MYKYLDFINQIFKELDEKVRKYNEDKKTFSDLKLQQKDKIEQEKENSIYLKNEYFNKEINRLNGNKKDIIDSLEKLKVELSFLNINFNNYKEDISDKVKYDSNDFFSNLKYLSEMIKELKSNDKKIDSLGNDKRLISKLFKTKSREVSIDYDLLSRVLFGINYVKNKEQKNIDDQLDKLKKEHRLDIKSTNDKYERLLNDNLKISFNDKITVDNNIYKKIIYDYKVVFGSTPFNRGEYSPFYYEFNYANFDSIVVNDIEKQLFEIVNVNDKNFKIPFITNKKIYFINFNFQNMLLFKFLENLVVDFIDNSEVGSFDIIDFGFNIKRNINNNFFELNNVLSNFVKKITTTSDLIKFINNNLSRKKIVYIDINSISPREILEVINNCNIDNVMIIILNDIKNNISDEYLNPIKLSCVSITIDTKIYFGNYEFSMYSKDNKNYIIDLNKKTIDYFEKEEIKSVKLCKRLVEINSIGSKQELVEKLREVIRLRNSYFSEKLSIDSRKLYNENGIYLGDYIYQSKFITSSFKSLILSQLSNGLNSQKVNIPIFIDPKKDGLNFSLIGRIANDFINTIVFSTLEYFPIDGIEYYFYNDLDSGINTKFFLENKKGLDSTFNFIYEKSELKKKLDEFVSNGQNLIENNLELSKNSLIEINQQNSDKTRKIKYVIIYNYENINDKSIENRIKKCLVNSEKFGVFFLIHSKNDVLEEIKPNFKFRCLNHDTGLLMDNQNIQIRYKRYTYDNIMLFLDYYRGQISNLKNESFGFNNIMPKVKDLFSKSTRELIRIPVGKNEDGEIQNFVIGDGSYHSLVSGATGSGKTVFLHTLIMSILFNYNSDEINLYLLDFKGGTEFKIYDNYQIPQIKVLALDAMQEFGESILENIISIMEKRSILFKNESVSKYSDYIDKGYKLPRILVIIDEFQILYNLSSNRKVANNAAELTKRIVTEGRSFGIHLLMSTQSTKILRDLSLASGTIEQMRIRVGLKLTESDSNYMFGMDNSSIALEKMKGPVGTAIYSKEYMENIPKAFRVAYIPPNIQNRYLYYISSNLSNEYKDKTLVFEGEKIPAIQDLMYKNIDKFLNTVIFIGERIKIAPPLSIEYVSKKNNNLLVVGDNDTILFRIINNILFSLSLDASSKIYLVDEDENYTINNGNFLDNFSSKKMYYSADSEKIEKNINDIFSEFSYRKSHKKLGDSIFLILINFHFSDTLNEIISGTFSESSKVKNTDSGFDFFSTTNKYLSYEDDLENDDIDENITIKDKFSQIIKEGYKFNIHTIVTLNDWNFYYENLFDFRTSFKNKIIFSLPSNDAERFIPDIDINQLKDNMAIYSDGMREKSQFKPYLIDCDNINILIEDLRNCIYGK